MLGQMKSIICCNFQLTLFDQTVIELFNAATLQANQMVVMPTIIDLIN